MKPRGNSGRGMKLINRCSARERCQSVIVSVATSSSSTVVNAWVNSWPSSSRSEEWVGRVVQEWTGDPQYSVHAFVNSSGVCHSSRMKEMRLWKQEEHNGAAIGAPGAVTTLNGNGYVSLRSGGSASTLGGNSGGGGALLRCCVYRLANVNIRRWILALVLITVFSIVCYTRLIDAPFST